MDWTTLALALYCGWMGGFFTALVIDVCAGSVAGWVLSVIARSLQKRERPAPSGGEREGG
jgi:hypothetical protein